MTSPDPLFPHKRLFVATSPNDSPSKQLAAKFIQRATKFHQNRNACMRLLVRFGDLPVWLSINNGSVAEITASIKPLTSYDVSISAKPEVWKRFWVSQPAPGNHDIFALAKNGDMQIEGNLQPLMAHLQFVKDLLAIGRG